MKKMSLSALSLSVALSLGFSSSAFADDIKVYFNAPVNAPATQDNLEQRMIDLIDSATYTLDMAYYDLDLPGVAQAMVNAKNRGVKVRFITDNDNVGGENTEAHTILTNGGVLWMDDTSDGSAGSGLQHQKLTVVDGRYVSTGSTNLTQSGVHGDLNAEGQLISDGNDNHIVIIDSVELADQVKQQMDYMWGDGPGGELDSMFGLSKPDHHLTTVYTTNDNIRIDVQFTPQSKSNYAGSGIETIANYVATANNSVDFAQFVISSQDIVDALQPRSDNGVVVRGIGDSSFFYRYYSEFQDMLGNVILKADGTEEIDSFTGAPNNAWSNPVDVRVAELTGGDKWHHKYIRVDDSVLTGSHNASGAASFTNDENIVIIYDPATALEFEAHFSTSYCFAGGGDESTCLDNVTPPQTEPSPGTESGTWEGVYFTGAEVDSVLDIVNNASRDQLDDAVELDSRAARNISKEKNITSMDELAAIGFVGQSAMSKLRDYVPTWNSL
jgi:phosphatidylserine/phosphatidylglycerophosphate/cardiolipin synthase-like enzyme